MQPTLPRYVHEVILKMSEESKAVCDLNAWGICGFLRQGQWWQKQKAGGQPGESAHLLQSGYEASYVLHGDRVLHRQPVALALHPRPADHDSSVSCQTCKDSRSVNVYTCVKGFQSPLTASFALQ